MTDCKHKWKYCYDGGPVCERCFCVMSVEEAERRLNAVEKLSARDAYKAAVVLFAHGERGWMAPLEAYREELEK